MTDTTEPSDADDRLQRVEALRERMRAATSRQTETSEPVAELPEASDKPPAPELPPEADDAPITAPTETFEAPTDQPAAGWPEPPVAGDEAPDQPEAPAGGFASIRGVRRLEIPRRETPPVERENTWGLGRQADGDAETRARTEFPTTDGTAAPPDHGAGGWPQPWREEPPVSPPDAETGAPRSGDHDDGANPILAAFEAKLTEPAPDVAEPDDESSEALPEAPASVWGDDAGEDDWEYDHEEAGRYRALSGTEQAPEDDEELAELLGPAAQRIDEDPDEEQPYSRVFQAVSDTETAPQPAWLTPSGDDYDDYDEDDDTDFYEPEPYADEDDWLEAFETEPGGGAVIAAPAADGSVRRQRVRTLVRDVVEMTLLGLLVFLVVKASVHRYRVEGESMFPTIEDGQQFIVNKVAYAEIDVSKIPGADGGEDPEHYIWGGPSRGDVIVFNDPRGGNQDLIKRIIGLPGETVEIRDGAVYINGHRLIEDYIVAPWGGNFDAIELPEDYYFVMGDNRSNSTDSRSFGPISHDTIIGQALAGVWPPDNWGLAPNEHPKCEDVPNCAPSAESSVAAP